MHRFIPDPARPDAPRTDPAHTAAIRSWTRELLKLTDDAVVTVSELACVDPGCPLIETTVCVFDADGRTRVWKFTRPAPAVTKLMVRQTLATPPARG